MATYDRHIYEILRKIYKELEVQNYLKSIEVKRNLNTTTDFIDKAINDIRNSKW